MIIHDFDVVRIRILPPKADSPLIVDADTVLPRAIAFQLLKSVAWRDAEVVECLGGIHGNQLPKHHPSQLCGVPPHWLAAEQARGISVGEALDHRDNITWRVSNGKRYYWRLANA